MEVKVIGQMDNTIDHTFESANRVYDVGGVSPTINTCGGGGLQPKILEDKTIVAMRGRNPDNPSDRTVGTPTEQRLEPNSQGLCNTLTSVQKDNLVMEVKQLGFMDNGTGKHQSNTVYDEKALCPNITTIEGGGTQQIKVMTETVRIKQATSQGYIECEVGGVADLSFPESNTRRGRVQEKGQVSPTIMAGEQDICRIERNDNFYLSDKGKKYVCNPKRGMCTDINADVCQTLTAKGQSNWTGSFVSEDIERIEKSATIGSDEPTIIHLKNGETITSNDDLTQYRIRKLTPRECWRLMDFTDEDFDKAAQVNSNTQLYKQAGNSIIRNVLVAIIGQMIPGKEEVYKNI